MLCPRSERGAGEVAMRNIMIQAAVARVIANAIVSRVVVAVAAMSHALGTTWSQKHCGSYPQDYAFQRSSWQLVPLRLEPTGRHERLQGRLCGRSGVTAGGLTSR